MHNTKINGVAAYPVVSVDDVAAQKAEFINVLREMVARKSLAENYEGVKKTIDWSVRGALVKRGRFDDLQEAGEETRKELADEVRQHVVKAVCRAWSPEGGANPATFATTTAVYSSLKAVDALTMMQSRFGASLDAPVVANEDGKNDSESTFSDITGDEVVPGGLRGSARIRMETDLALIREMLTDDDWAVFIRRFEGKVSNRELAEELGWTEDRIRWFLKGYQKRLSRLLGVRPPRCRRMA